MEWEEMCLLAEEYQESLQEIGIDNAEIIEKARQKSWEKFKTENSNVKKVLLMLFFSENSLIPWILNWSSFWKLSIFKGIIL